MKLLVTINNIRCIKASELNEVNMIVSYIVYAVLILGILERFGLLSIIISTIKIAWDLLTLVLKIIHYIVFIIYYKIKKIYVQKKLYEKTVS